MMVYVVGLQGPEETSIVAITMSRSVAAGLLRKLRSQPFHQNHQWPFVDHVGLLESSDLLRVRTIHSVWKSGSRFRDMTYARSEWTFEDYLCPDEGTESDDYAWALTEERARELLEEVSRAARA